MRKKKKILGASIGNCIHTVGILKFLDIAKREGHETVFLGARISIDELIKNILVLKPDIVAVSYRLTPGVAEKLFMDLKYEIERNNLSKIDFVFGGTKAVSLIAEKTKIFVKILNSIRDVLKYLQNKNEDKQIDYPQTLIDRINYFHPYPLIRHHFGMPSLKETIRGVRDIAKSEVVDIISIGPDQNAQEFFFEPEKMKDNLSGAGGVPIRKRKDLVDLYETSRIGNQPLLRCYSGTNHLIKWAEMSVETIHNCFGAIPLFWYSQLDGRSSRPLKDAIIENQQAMKWYGKRDIPVEVNDSHQWAFRYCGDVMEVADAFLVAYNAKKLGVKYYIQQYMFNTPRNISPKMDLAKMFAKLELVEGLHDTNFIPYRMTRTGCDSMPADFDEAKGQLASSIRTSMHINPHIVHVVAYCEVHDVTTQKELIESCKIAKGVITDSLLGLPDVTKDEEIRKRKKVLIEEAKLLISSIESMGELTNPETLVQAVTSGLLDAEHLKGNRYAKGEIKTRIIDGACYVVDENGNILPEKKRLKKNL